ncbi:MAG: hypothetical protein QOI40_2123 [Alphaproteobacteria bacterium]|jgi:hypothetical protein|nr:hypothetical protein [Alphaproteobacteria bacterium]
MFERKILAMAAVLASLSAPALAQNSPTDSRQQQQQPQQPAPDNSAPSQPH